MIKFGLIVVIAAFAIYFFYPKSPEARQWLSKNNNKYALAGNRFTSTEDAIAFVDSLYAAGAVKVSIPKDSIYDDEKRIKTEGGPYADALEITLPQSQSEQEELFGIINQEAIKQGMAFNPSEDVLRNRALFWWD